MAHTSTLTTLPFSTRGERLIGQEMFKVLDRAQRLELDGQYVYHLELGNPRMEPPAEIIEATLEAIRGKQLGYTPMAGLRELRAALAARHALMTGRNFDDRHVVISPANLLISQFLDLTCNTGDRVVLFTPAFPSYWAATAHIGLDVMAVSLTQDTGFHLAESHIDAAIAAAPKAIIVNSANNPTGAVYTKPMLELLAQRCDQEGIWLLSDETYGELSFSWPFFSLASCEMPQLVVMSSFSKLCSIPGYRIGYALAHPAVAEKLALSSSTLISCLPAFTQLGCLAGLSILDQYAAQVKAHCSRVTSACALLINHSGILRSTSPEAGFYLFVDIGATGMDDMAFCKRLLEEWHTAVTPGRSFSADCSTFIRIATCGQEQDVMEGVRRVVALAHDVGGMHVAA